MKVLWNKYWVSTLAWSTLMTNHSYMTDQLKGLTKKLKSAERALLSTDIYQERYLPREKNKVDELANIVKLSLTKLEDA